MPKKTRTTASVVFQPRAWHGMQRGAMQIVRAITPTLGPTPRIVAHSPEFGSHTPDLYDNGGEIARRVLAIRNRDEDVGAMMLRDLLWRLQNQVGDGTATAAVLFGSVYTQGIRYLTAGGNSRRLQTHLDNGLEVMVAELGRMTRHLQGKDQLARIAQSISYDPELARYMGEIFDIIGVHGRLEIRKGRSLVIEREYVEGLYWERGLMSREMIDDHTRMRTAFENPAILLSDLEITEPQALLPVLETARTNQIKSLLIIAAKLSDAVIGFLLANSKTEEFKVIAVTTPEYGKDPQATALLDLAILTGGKLFLKATADTFAHITAQDFGHARRAWADLRNFGVIGGKGDARALRHHVFELRQAYENTDSPVPKEKLRERLGKLLGGSATLWVGADTEMLMERRLELAKRTAAAMRLAMEEGVTPGAGVALLACRPALQARLAQVQEEDERAAYEILIQAAAVPARTIARNAGLDPSDIMAEMRLAGPGYGLDAIAEEVVDVTEAGIFDPAGVLKAALFGAVKTAALCLTVDAIVHHKNPEQAQPLRPTARMKL